jgi:hypothetical protein
MRVWVTVEVDYPVDKPSGDLDEELLSRYVRNSNVEAIVGWDCPDQREAK